MVPSFGPLTAFYSEVSPLCPMCESKSFFPTQCRRRNETMASFPSPDHEHTMLTLTRKFASSQLPSIWPQNLQCVPFNFGLRSVPDQVGRCLLVGSPAHKPLEGSVSPLQLLLGLLSKCNDAPCLGSCFLGQGQQSPSDSTLRCVFSSISSSLVEISNLNLPWRGLLGSFATMLVLQTSCFPSWKQHPKVVSL